MNKKIIKSSIWTIVPVIIWNLAFYRHLPDAYQEGKGWEEFPVLFDYLEMGLRVITFISLIFLTIEIKTKLQKIGLVLYLGGIVVYFLSWTIQIVEPTSDWSASTFGFSAPALTPIIWLIGIGMMSKAMSDKTKFILPGYYVVAVLFILVHSFHALIVYHGMR